MKHYTFTTLTLLLLVLFSCNTKTKEKENKLTEVSSRIAPQAEKDNNEGLIALDDDLEITLGPIDSDDEMEEDDLPMTEKPKFGYTIADDVWLVRLDTLSPLADTSYFRMAERIAPTGVDLRFIYPKGQYNKYVSKLNSYRKFCGGWSFRGFNMDGPLDENEYRGLVTIKNKLGSYVFNPNRKPLVGLLISTVDAPPVFYEGEDIDCVETIKKHFNIETKEELMALIKSKVKIANEMVVAHNKAFLATHYAESKYDFDKKQTKLLNEYIIEELFAIKAQFVMNKQRLMDYAESDVKKKILAYDLGGHFPDTVYMAFEYGKGNRLEAVEVTQKKDKRYDVKYTVGYDGNGLVDKLYSNEKPKLQIYAYQDSIVCVTLPQYYDYLTAKPETKTMILTSDNSLPEKIVLGRNNVSILKFDEKRQLISYESIFLDHNFATGYYYSYKGDQLKQLEYKVNNIDSQGNTVSQNIVYQSIYKDNRIELKMNGATYTQSLTYDKKKNLTSAIFDKKPTAFGETGHVVDAIFTYTY